MQRSSWSRKQAGESMRQAFFRTSNSVSISRRARAFNPCRAAIANVSSPIGAPAPVCSHGLSAPGRQRLCLARTSQSAGAPSACAQHQRHQIGLALGSVDQACGGQLRCHLGDPFLSFDPAQAFLRRTAPGRGRARRVQLTCRAFLHSATDRPNSPWPVKSRSVVSCRHSAAGSAAMRCAVCCQCGAMLTCQSTLSLSTKRYAAIVSPQPWHIFGTIAVGSAANRSVKILARWFRRTSPRLNCSNAVSVQGAGAVANCAFKRRD